MEETLTRTTLSAANKDPSTAAPILVPSDHQSKCSLNAMGEMGGRAGRSAMGGRGARSDLSPSMLANKV